MQILINSVSIFFLATIFLVPLAVAKNVELYISMSGNDNNLGTTMSSPVRTLRQALNMAKEITDLTGDILITFMGGDYRNDNLEVNWFPQGNHKLILLGRSASGIASFDGGNTQATWLVIRGERNTPTNLTVRGFEVRNYRGAIVVYGDPFDNGTWSSKSRIEDNLFENIGQFTSTVTPSYAAITLTNSRRNFISGNYFINIRNLEKCDGLHAIYLFGGSINNAISKNFFIGGCGDTIKVRHRSNFNVISGNIFYAQEGKALLVDSYCDKRKSAECREKPQECPSHGNEFRDNQVDVASQAAVKSLTRKVGADRIPGCPDINLKMERIEIKSSLAH